MLPDKGGQSILITLFPYQKFGYHNYNEMLTVGNFKCFQRSGTGSYCSQDTDAFTMAFTRQETLPSPSVCSTIGCQDMFL